MKRLAFSFILCLVTLTLFALALVPIVSMNVQFARIIKNDLSAWNIEVNILPIIPLFIFCVVLTFVYFVLRKKRKVSFWLYPLDMPAEDEREKAISSEACRKAFGTIWFAAPLCAGLMCFYPLFVDARFRYTRF
ncbi:hypothetical protein QS257_02810 [Terrilactibacillus sp. S3-3]|nr:hypothetical protein QS257_02810 [Terrilactibacillus sp. S3-3]